MGKQKSKSAKRQPVTVRKHKLLLKALRTEPNFLKYMEVLKSCAEEYCVMIAVHDSLNLPVSTREISNALTKMGLRMEFNGKRIDFYGIVRFTYAAMIDAGQVIFEELRPGHIDGIDEKLTVGKREIELVSTSTDSSDAAGLILIDGKDHSLNMRGLNIVVFDKSNGTVLDTTNFNCFNPTVPRTFANYELQALRDFADAHPDVSLICMRRPVLPVFFDKPLTSWERFVIDNKIVYSTADPNVLVLNKYFDKAGLAEVLSTPKSYLDWNGIRRFEDKHGKYVNISGGHRVTAYQPDKFQRTIFLLYNCHMFGIGVDDSRTIESWLQLKCNETIPDAGIIVQNYGFFLYSSDMEENSKILTELPVKSGDIVIFDYQLSDLSSREFTTINLMQAACRPRDYEMFFDFDHYTPDGCRIIAEELFKGLMDLGLLHSSPKSTQRQSKPVPKDRPGSDLRSTCDFAGYLKLLRTYAQRYCILVSSWDVSGGPGFTEELLEIFRAVGFQSNLTGKPYCAYAAAIDAGELVYEELCEDAAQYIDVTLTDEDFKFEANIVSRGANSEQTEKNPIEINGNSYSSKRQGLHIVVYDKIEQAAIDAVNFDISLDSVPCYHDQEGIQTDIPVKADAGTLMSANLPAVEVTQKELPFEADTYKELSQYKKALTDWYDQTFSITIGSIVMNCNPFTLGHRFLIETALAQCDFLIIFVVQEDKSRFPFEDRMRLVKEGVADLKNVAVLPSGKFVLSSLTFSEYFNKSELQDRIIDTSLDVTVFAREIAPCLHITKRFAGEEPFDAVTRQYNETLRRILPEYGIEFVEVPRKTTAQGGAVISASQVRDLLEKGNFEAIRPLVPESTFHYLMQLSDDVNQALRRP